MTTAFNLALGAGLGAVIGSYATTVALRASATSAPHGPRSRCDGCDRVLGWRETLPVVSYVALRGRCRACGDAISPFHPVGETVGLVTGLVLALLIRDIRLIPLAAIAAALLAAAVFDARTRLLPDLSTLIVAVCGAGLAFARDRLAEGLGAAAIAALVLLGARAVARTRDGAPGLGLGDVKLVGALALWLGLATPWMVFLAAVIGLAVTALRRPGDGKIAFGPMIAASGLCVGLLVEANLWPGLS